MSSDVQPKMDIICVTVAPRSARATSVAAELRATGGRGVSSMEAKFADEILDYEIDWTDRLRGEIITQALWELTGDGDITDPGLDGSFVRVRLEGGAPGTILQLCCTITTTAGKVLEEMVMVPVR